MIGGVAMQLISSAAGYWVLTQASKEKGRVRQIGQFLGLFIIVVSLVGASCKLYYLSKMSGLCPPGATCPFMKKIQ